MEENFNSDQWWNNDKCQCECKKHHICEKDYIRNPATCSCEDGKYLASIWMIQQLRVIKLLKKKQKQLQQILMEKNNFISKKKISKPKTFYMLLAFLLITIALLIAVSTYCYLIKYKAKQKHLLPFYIRNNKLKEVLY